MSVEKLAALSRRYGSDTAYVIAGGGNTSFKDEKTLWIKASGAALSDITPDGFVAMDRALLAGIWKKTYSADPKEREASVLADLLAARKPGEENKRPSVETLLHDLLPFAWVVHLHPALVNGLTCSVEAEKAAARLFPDAIWIPCVNPGYILSLAVKEALDARRAKGENPPLVFLQNHGVFAASDTVDGIDGLYRGIMEKMEAAVHERPDFSGDQSVFGGSAEAAAVLEALLKKSGAERGAVLFERNNAVAALVRDRASFYPVSSAFTPDHIVYAGSDPLFIEAPGGKAAAVHIEEAWKKHVEKTGRIPKIAALQDTGIFGLGISPKAASLAVELFNDAIKVAVYTRSFGGPRFMEADKIQFINTWEVEQFRSQRSGS
jgi:rhamnose utilization protein RhaD (predicted bifunctional aldolase and dehydrogenase)